MHKMAELFSQAASFPHYAKLYNARLAELLDALDMEALGRAVDAFATAREAGKSLYIMGNGGSAAIAAHLVNDLVAGAYIEGAQNFRVFSLSDNVATVTALANDSGYESLFVRQLKVQLQPGDVVMALSVSGNSPNILRGLEYARSCGNTTIGLCGFTGGKMIGLCDIAVLAETTLDEYGPVEDVFSIVCPILSGYLSMTCGKQLHH